MLKWIRKTITYNLTSMKLDDARRTWHDVDDAIKFPFEDDVH